MFECLRDHCKQCCHKDENADAVKRYPKARLEVCTCKFGAYPQIQGNHFYSVSLLIPYSCSLHFFSLGFCLYLAFVKSDRPDKFPNLNIRYVRGLDPVIKLLDEDSNIQEVHFKSCFLTFANCLGLFLWTN